MPVLDRLDEKTPGGEVDRVTGAVAALRKFLEDVGESSRAASLQAIETDLGVPERRRLALSRLEEAFGGMGSLNDLWLAPPASKSSARDGRTADANRDLAKLLDSCYREVRLAHVPWWWCRPFWKFLAWRNRAGVPPRIRRAFR